MRYQALPLSDERWDFDMDLLLQALGRATRRRGRRSAWLIGSSAAAALVALAAWLVLGGRAPAEAGGRWVADVRYDFGVNQREVFRFTLEGEKLLGTASFLGVDRTVREGKVRGEEITFTTVTSEAAGSESREARHLYRGTVQAQEIRFTMQTEGGFSEHPPVDFVARRESGPP
ncbi:MAG: hypothetical protein FJW35_00870 [Acidobacteria bacterium]|nr:hypothetical protein [Acidobacteriota bacterium]